MSYLTEYFDEYRQHPIRKTQMCSPECRWAKIDGKWLDPKIGTQDKEMSDDEIKDFIKATMKSLRGQSTYYNDYCAHIPPELKTRPFIPRPPKKPDCSEKKKTEEEEHIPVEAPKLAMKDTELMKGAKELYERDMEARTMEPLKTHLRLHGYGRLCNFRTGLSDYQDGIARLAYEMIRDDRIPRYYKHNGNRAKWGLPPEGTRQPELDGLPFEGDRLF